VSEYGQPPGYGPPYGASGYGPPLGRPTGPRMDALAVVALIGGLLAIVGATANLVSGFCGALCPLCTIGGAIIGAIVAIPAIIGIVCGILGYHRTTREPERYTGKGLALAGAITGGIAILLTIATVVGPWLGFGCMAATAPPAPAAAPFDPFAIDAGALGLPSHLPPAVSPPAVTGDGRCARVATCCAAYVAAMGGEVPATVCDGSEDFAGMAEAVCESALSGYRDELTSTGRTPPPECASDPIP